MPDDVAERHAGAAKVIQSRLISRIVAMGESDLAGLAPADIVRMWSEAVRIERDSTPSPDPQQLAASLGLDEN